LNFNRVVDLHQVVMPFVDWNNQLMPSMSYLVEIMNEMNRGNIPKSLRYLGDDISIG